MTLKKALFPTLLLTAFLMAACAVNSETEDYYSQDRVMKAWMNCNYPGLTPYGNTGAYVIDMVKGEGTPVTDSSYIRVFYTKRTLDGDITSTNDQELAEQLGEYAKSYWYGGNTWRVDQGYLPEALETVLKTMRAGGRLKMALPASASSHDYSLYDAFTSTSESDNQIIDLTIDTW